MKSDFKQQKGAPVKYVISTRVKITHLDLQCGRLSRHMTHIEIALGPNRNLIQLPEVCAESC